MPDDILNKVISFISGENENASDKDILLKQLAREITQNKYAKFYRVKQHEVDIPFAQYFFNLYKAVYPLQIFLKDPAKDAKIRQITLESFLDKKVMDLIKMLSPDGIAERKRALGDDITKQLEEDLAVLTAGFDSPKIATADKCYNLIAAMKQFVAFDFCSLLKKFDPEIKEGDFLTPPKFAQVDVGILTGEIATFLSVIPAYNEADDWKTVFEILKYCKGGTDVVPPALWTNVLIGLSDLKQSRILELIERLAAGNPILEIKAMIPRESLSGSWLEQKTAEVREVINGIAGSQRKAQIQVIEQAVFGSLATTRLNFYTAEKQTILLDKKLTGYLYAPALNHLFTFIHEFLNKDIHELCDIVLIRGKWTNVSSSLQMSDNYHALEGIIDEIAALDSTLDEDGSNGPRLRGALLRVDRDKTQARYINSIIKSINEEALNIINRAVSSLIVVGKHFKMLLDDCDKKHSELVMNWKELGVYSKTPMNQRINATYKRINYFVQLMILETKPLDA